MTMINNKKGTIKSVDEMLKRLVFAYLVLLVKIRFFHSPRVRNKTYTLLAGITYYYIIVYNNLNIFIKQLQVIVMYEL